MCIRDRYTNEINCMQENTDESNCSRIRNRETINDIRNRNTETRHAHGEYKNVLLSDSDFEKLKSEFPSDYEQRIENLSSYMASKGKAYKNHLATIRNWARRDAEKASDAGKTKNTRQAQNYTGREYSDEFLNGLYKEV